MTVSDFFRLALKLFALYSLVIAVIVFLPGSSNVLFYDFGWQAILWICFVIIVTLFLFIALAFNSDRIVERLKLAKGFESTHIPFEKLDAPTIIKIGCIIIAGLTFLDNVPKLLTHLYVAVRIQAPTFPLDYYMGYDSEKNIFELAVCVLNLVISYLLFTNYHWVSRWLTSQGEQV